MKKLIFKLNYAGKILAGEKVTTIRLSANVRKGDVVEVYVGHARIGKAVITRVTKKKLSSISDKEARMDGFRNKEELVKALMKIYGKKRVDEDPEVYIIEFKLL
ncbi:MAG: hypothetical protein DRO12_02560 [Thermoprotei archaeon]|nr:MAG: hypothetical protein DRO12_02560 [Thermoprotei archaeon]